MARYEEGHASHIQSTEEALYLGLSGETVERRKLAHCYQIANHMKDIYADDITLSVAPADKLLGFLESTLAAAVADRPEVSRDGAPPVTAGADRRSPRSTPRSRSPSSSATTSPARATVSTTSRAPPAARHRRRRRRRVQGAVPRARPRPSESDYRKALVAAARVRRFESQKRAESRFRIVSMNDGVDRPRRPLINRNAVGARACERPSGAKSTREVVAAGALRCSWSVR